MKIINNKKEFQEWLNDKKRKEIIDIFYTYAKRQTEKIKVEKNKITHKWENEKELLFFPKLSIEELIFDINEHNNFDFPMKILNIKIDSQAKNPHFFNKTNTIVLAIDKNKTKGKDQENEAIYQFGHEIIHYLLFWYIKHHSSKEWQQTFKKISEKNEPLEQSFCEAFTLYILNWYDRVDYKDESINLLKNNNKEFLDINIVPNLVLTFYKIILKSWNFEKLNLTDWLKLLNELIKNKEKEKNMWKGVK